MKLSLELLFWKGLCFADWGKNRAKHLHKADLINNLVFAF